MSLFMQLYDTYNLCEGKVGVYDEQGGKIPLTPLCHTIQQAHIEVAITKEGEFFSSRVIESKSDQLTIIPCTEPSSQRTSNKAPHPLFDSLKYVAGDYCKEGDSKKAFFESYREGLAAWCASDFSHDSIKAVLAYVDKKSLMKDLEEHDILFKPSDGPFPEKWNKKESGGRDKPKIFDVCPEQLKAFIRFRVVGAKEERLWRDPDLWMQWIGYQGSLSSEKNMCYITGEEGASAQANPRKIRSIGDGAKLISSNDKDNFTFRGRFSEASEACSVSREATDKAHGALRWLISRQGYNYEGRVLLAWRVQKEISPCMLAVDSPSILRDLERIGGSKKQLISTGEEFADRFNKALAGYGSNLRAGELMSVVELDAASPGRLSVLYYREMQAQDLLTRIQKWHTSCAWRHTYAFEEAGLDKKGKPLRKYFEFVGAPSLKDIAEAAYGSKIDEKLTKATIERLLPCIVDGARLPRDVMVSAFNRASRAGSMEAEEASKTISIACALIKKYYSENELKEVISVALEEENTDRSYLFGRVLAYAREIEESAQRIAQSKHRQTNAERYQVMFSRHPVKTWQLLENQLHPYFLRLHGEAKYDLYEPELRGILDKIPVAQFNDEVLSPLYLLGYSSQIAYFRNQENLAKKDEDPTISENLDTAEV